MMILRLAVTLSFLLGCSNGFIPHSMKSRNPGEKKTGPSSSSLGMITDPAVAEEITSARFAFWMCFYGAAGVGSIGRELIPIVFGRYQSNKELSSASMTTSQNSDPTQDLGIWGYSEKIYKSDVEKILNNPLSAAAIANKYPIESIKGSAERYEYTHIEKPLFLSYDAYVLANPRANPVALRAVFDGFSNSIGGGNAVSAILAQERIDLYRQDVGKMVNKLNSGKLLGISAFLLVLVLLGCADYLAIYHVWRGWFPEWQGFSNMPTSLFSKDIGFPVLPDYFLADVPEL